MEIIEELEQWAAANAKGKKTKAQVAFLKIRQEVQQAVDAGYDVKTIWGYLHDRGRFAYGYDTFRFLVYRHTTKQPRAAKRTTVDTRGEAWTRRPPAQGPQGEEEKIQTYFNRGPSHDKVDDLVGRLREQTRGQ